jgi:signal transduction histidine kinase
VLNNYASAAAEISSLKGIFFKVDAQLHDDSVTLLNEKTENIFFDVALKSKLIVSSQKTGNFVELIYHYDAAPVALTGVILWMALSTLLTPVVILFSRHLEKVNSTEHELLANKQFSDLARQVAHDIRAPLSALNAVTTKIGSLHPNERDLLVTISNRINSVAEDLLEISKRSINQKNNSEKKMLTFSPISTLKGITKEIQLASPKVSINQIFLQDLESYKCFGDSVKFGQICSNIFRNSLESMQDRNVANWKISVRASYDGSFMKIIFTDNGRGIPDHILDRIGELGFSHGDKNGRSGNGLGIYFAKKNIEEWGGAFTITSQLGEGTSVAICLKIS